MQRKIDNPKKTKDEVQKELKKERWIEDGDSRRREGKTKHLRWDRMIQFIQIGCVVNNDRSIPHPSLCLNNPLYVISS